jgi:hypothetical protein
MTASTRRCDLNRVERSGVDAALVDGTRPHPNHWVEPEWSDNRGHRGEDCVGIRIPEIGQQRANAPWVLGPDESECVRHTNVVVGALFGAQGWQKAVANHEVSHHSPAQAIENQSKVHAAMGASENRSIRNVAAAPP